MTLTSYLSFVVFAVILVLVPGPDFTVVVKNLITGGRPAGLATSLGVATSNLIQGIVAALGLGAVIVGIRPLFDAIRWAGVVYLAYLGVQAMRSAVRGRAAGSESDGDGGGEDRGRRLTGWRQGFLSNITNPKVLTFYLSVLPQFLPRDHVAPGDLVALVLTHAVISLVWLSAVVAALGGVRSWLRQRAVRRALDAVTGCALLGFSAKLAREHP
ncbi:LysE family translocator [Actinomadura sp. HBU206391]|uniref:LysE family translocator n=1 Tax=Actinomadura sp. HBU206391 TaxID=2731692 RepID=UPI001650CC34|nr:LysE family translocator [Actinomadura sp. HBU206391]MBC6459822.1 LysE family translocator [Actinomadura sp. HBU206391]